MNLNDCGIFSPRTSCTEHLQFSSEVAMRLDSQLTVDELDAAAKLLTADSRCCRCCGVTNTLWSVAVRRNQACCKTSQIRWCIFAGPVGCGAAGPLRFIWSHCCRQSCWLIRVWSQQSATDECTEMVKQNDGKCPRVTEVARHCLSVPVASEWLLSSAGDL